MVAVDRSDSEGIVADQLVIGAVAQETVDPRVDRIPHEPDRAVAEEKIGAGGMPAGIAADVVERQAAVLHQ